MPPKRARGGARLTRLTLPPNDPMCGRPEADRLRKPMEGRALPSPLPSDSDDGDSGCRGAATMLLRVSKAVAEWLAIGATGLCPRLRSAVLPADGPASRAASLPRRAWVRPSPRDELQGDP